MKLLMLSILFLSCFFTANVFASEICSSSFDATGAVKERCQKFIKVKNTSGGEKGVGSVMTLDLTADDGISVTTSTSASAQPLCLIAEVACASNAMCKCQTYGYFSAALFDNENGNASAGDVAYISENTAGYIEAESSAAFSDVPIGRFYDAVTATGATELFLLLD
jgi:hypothetical protein